MIRHLLSPPTLPFAKLDGVVAFYRTRMDMGIGSGYLHWFAKVSLKYTGMVWRPLPAREFKYSGYFKRAEKFGGVVCRFFTFFDWKTFLARLNSDCVSLFFWWGGRAMRHTAIAFALASSKKTPNQPPKIGKSPKILLFRIFLPRLLPYNTITRAAKEDC